MPSEGRSLRFSDASCEFLTIDLLRKKRAKISLLERQRSSGKFPGMPFWCFRCASGRRFCPMPKLTKRFVDSLGAKDTDYFAWDDGFGVRTWISGRKSYVTQYRKAGPSRRVKIGAHGALTVEEARKEAKAILGDVARGEDPAEDRATRRKSITVGELCDNYLAAAEAGLIMGKRNLPKKPSTRQRSRTDRTAYQAPSRQQAGSRPHPRGRESVYQGRDGRQDGAHRKVGQEARQVGGRGRRWHCCAHCRASRRHSNVCGSRRHSTG